MRRLAVLIAFLLIAPAAHADSIVFRRGGDVWRMAPDGTSQRQLTSGGGYEWPSAADDGTFAASDATGQVHRWTAAGAPVNVIPVATSTDEDAPTETPTHVRLSPDGARIAYDQAIEGDVTTIVTGADATVAAPAGQDGFIRPSWIGNEQLLLSRDVSFDSEGTTFSRYALGAAVAPWFSDPGLSWATGFDAAASRDGSRLAVVADDSAESEGAPTRVVLRLYTGTTVRCELGLEAADTFVSASPSLSPDGSRVAWAESDGIHVADCGGERVVTLPGAWEPYWSAYTEPRTADVPRLSLGLRVKERPRKARVRRLGVGMRVTVSAPATVRVAVGKRVVTRMFDQAGTYTVRVKVRAAKRYTVRVSAPGAEPAVAVVRPR